MTTDGEVAPAPEILYHYCSNSTLVSILQTKQIWVSDPRFLNDSREYRHAGEIFAQTVYQIASEYRQTYLDLTLPEKVFDDWVRRLASAFEKVSVFPLYDKWSPYIFCLSREWDSLSQWRAYGNGEYCIGFDRAELQRKAGQIFDVGYRKLQPDMSIADNIRSFFRAHTRHVHVGRLEPEVASIPHHDFENLRHRHWFLTIKDDGFRSEFESRLILKLDPRDPRIFFHAGGRYPVPRAKIDIFDSPESAAALIKEIVCGPGADFERAEAAFEMIWRVLKIRPKITHSKVPYRAF